MFKQSRLIALLLVLFGNALFAEEPDINAVAKRIYDKDTGVPNHIIFRSVLREVASMHAQNPEFAWHHVAYYLGPHTDRELIDPTLAIFLDLEKQMKAEILDTEVSILCPSSKAAWSKAKTYRVLDSLDDARFAISQKYYVIASNRIDSNAFDGFVSSIEAQDSFSAVQIDNKKYYEQSGEDVINASNAICTSLKERQRVENR